MNKSDDKNTKEPSGFALQPIEADGLFVPSEQTLDIAAQYLVENLWKLGQDAGPYKTAPSLKQHKKSSFRHSPPNPDMSSNELLEQQINLLLDRLKGYDETTFDYDWVEEQLTARLFENKIGTNPEEIMAYVLALLKNELIGEEDYQDYVSSKSTAFLMKTTSKIYRLLYSGEDLHESENNLYMIISLNEAELAQRGIVIEIDEPATSEAIGRISYRKTSLKSALNKIGVEE